MSTKKKRKMFDSKREPKFARDFERAIDAMTLPPLDAMTDDSIHESYDKDDVFAAHSNYEYWRAKGLFPEDEPVKAAG